MVEILQHDTTPPTIEVYGQLIMWVPSQLTFCSKYKDENAPWVALDLDDWIPTSTLDDPEELEEAITLLHALAWLKSQGGVEVKVSEQVLKAFFGDAEVEISKIKFRPDED